MFHHPTCTTSLHALDQVQERDDVEVIHYLKTPLDRPALVELLGTLEDEPGELVRKDPFFKGLGLDAADYVTVDAVADLLVQYPRLMQRPVLVRGGRAIIGRPKDRVAAFLAD